MRLRSAVAAAAGPPCQSRSCTTRYGPIGSPLAVKTSFMYSLSKLTALASTPAPTYGTPAISSRPWIVPSSPNGPCRIGRTTSTPARTPGTDATEAAGAGATAVPPAPRSAPAPGPATAPGSAPGPGPAPASGPATAATEGRVLPLMASRSGSSLVSTHRPSGRMPTGTTS